MRSGESDIDGEDRASCRDYRPALADDRVLVSVLINNFNYGQFLRQAIDSALSQNYRNVEVIVVDDGSTDQSRAIIAEYGDRVKAVYKLNGGQSSALNAGFAVSAGEIICLLDSDDWFFPSKVETVVEHFTSNAEFEWVFDPVLMKFPNGSTEVSPQKFPHDILVDVRGFPGKSGPNGPPTSGLSFSRGLLNRLLPMSDDIRVYSDNYLKFAGVSIALGLQLCEPLTAQRIHDRNLATRRTDKLLERTRFHLLIARELRRNFPMASRFGDKVFAKTVADYLRMGQRDAACEEVILNYLKQCPFRDLIDVVPRTLFHFVRSVAAKK
jgi:glycosyltransferase involved in cell wall biosynthesis